MGAMVIGVAIVLFLAILIFRSGVKARAAIAQKEVERAYLQGAADAAARLSEPAASTSRRRPALKPATSRDPSLGFWTDPPVPVATDDELHARLDALDGRQPEICFTGWARDLEPLLEQRAQEAGFRIRTGVTKRLTFLCVGENPGPSKLDQARLQGVAILSGDQLQRLIRSPASGEPSDN